MSWLCDIHAVDSSVPFELYVKLVKHMSMCISPLSIQISPMARLNEGYSGLVILHMKVCIFV